MTEFLATAGWGDAERQPLAGDASSRQYERLAMGAAKAVLMRDPDGDVRRFLHIARHLSEHSFSAPRILTAAPEHGLVLMEDLGDGLLARVAEAEPGREEALYIAATDVLVALHQMPLPSGLEPYGPSEMAAMIAPAIEVYAPAAECSVSKADRLRLTSALEQTLLANDMPPPVLIHRDYHAENLLWLPDRTGPARIGLLDFQDALAGHPAYDLASLLGDVRRDVPAPVKEAAIRRYVAATGQDDALFRTALAAQGAQRNLRILGVFATLCLRRGKPGYLALMPRVWALLMEDLAVPDLAELRAALFHAIPEPTAERLKRIRGAAT